MRSAGEQSALNLITVHLATFRPVTAGGQVERDRGELSVPFVLRSVLGRVAVLPDRPTHLQTHTVIGAALDVPSPARVLRCSPSR